MRFKKILSAVLAAVLATQASALTSFADVNANSENPSVLDATSVDKASGSGDKADEVLYTAEFSLEADEFNAEEAEKRYFHQLMYADLDSQSIGVYNSAYSRKTLTESQIAIYDTILPELINIAAGKRDDTEVEIIPKAAYNSLADFKSDLSSAISCLMRDYPECLFWFGRAWSISYMPDLTWFSVTFTISEAYASANDSQKINTAMIERAQTAISTARDLAKSCEALPDHQKIFAFCDKICELNSYDHKAAEVSTQIPNYPKTDCSPWEIVSVFDDDPYTNVVCEGYSKAMQYLCDLSGIDCYIATSSDHMWNIVSLDGKSYHVDVTFADTGTGDDDNGLSLVKEYHPFVLKGASYSDGKRVEIYTKIPGYTGKTSTYYYEDKTINLLPESIRKVSTEDYDVSVIANLASTPDANSIKLTWSKHSLSSYYKVFIREDNKWTQLTATTNNATLEYMASGLAENTSYNFRVSGFNSSGEEIAYSEITATTKYGTIANLKAAPTDSTVKLTWGKNASASYYKVFTWKDSKWTQLTKTGSNETVAYTASKLVGNTSYKFRVTAYNSSDKAIAYSDITSKTKYGTTANLKATPTSSTVKLTWGKNTSASYYKVFIWKNSKWTQLTKTGSNETVAYAASNLVGNTSYKFRVTAYNSSDTAIAYSDITSKTKYGTVANLNATPTDSTVKLAWGKNTLASYYKVFIWKDSKWTQLTKTDSNATVAYTASKLVGNTSYKFRVTAYNSSDTAIAYSDITAKTNYGTIANLNATPTDSTVKLAWGKNTSASYYKVFIWKDSKWTQLTKTGSNATVAYAASNLVGNTSYKFRVTAYNSSNTAIAYSDITAKTNYGTIVSLKAVSAKNSVKLTWGKNASASYYKVFIWKDSKWTQLTKTGSNATVAYTASKLTANTSYKFRVTAYNSSDKAIAYSDITAKTTA